ncbi:MAG: GbsR/MarR family transcriptional regulator [Hyphomicrobiaceae bacterium]
MTEMTVHKAPMPPAVQRFVLHWGEMGATWGVNRSIGQIHALLYLSGHPLPAEDIAETLSLARSNVSNSLKELIGWGLIRRVQVLGDRRDFFEAEADLWEMVTRIAEGRKARELDPTMTTLKACMAEAESDRFMDPKAKERIAAMLSFVEMIDKWATDMRRVPRTKLMMLMRLGSAILRFLPIKGDMGKVDIGKGDIGTGTKDSADNDQKWRG